MRSHLYSAALLALAIGSVAHADEVVAQTDLYPREVVKRPLTLHAGMYELDLDVLVGLSASDAGQPIMFTPSLFRGITDTFQLGIVTRHGLCDGCGNAVDDVGLHARFLLVPAGDVHLALEAGVDVLSFDAGTVGIPIRAIVRFVVGDRIDLLLLPGITFGLNKRDEASNRDLLALDAFGRYQVDDGVNLFLHVFYGGLVDPPAGSFSDFASGGIGVGATYTWGNAFDLGAEFDFNTLFDQGGGADGRQVIAHAAIRFGH